MTLNPEVRFIGGPNDRYKPQSVPDGWKWTRLTDVALLETGHTPDRKNSNYWSGDIGWVSLQDTESLDQPEITETTHSITEAGIANSSARLLPKGTVIFSRTATVGKSTLLGAEMATSQDFMNYVCGDRVSNVYLVQAFRSMKRTWHSLMAGSTHSTIYKGDFQNLRLLLPPINVQIRIAGVGRYWDRAIELTERLVAGKQKRKQALLQQLLSRQPRNSSPRKLGELFKHRKEKGTDGLPTYSVTMDDGLVLRDSLDRKNDTTLRPDEHLLIEKDDIAYNMMRMWQGASGLAPESGLVSPAYVVVRSLGDLDPLFASYWFKTRRVVKKFQDYSHGLTKDRLRLYFKDFASITLPVPPLDWQRKIAKALSACDRELDCLNRKWRLLNQQKKGLMHQLLTGKIRVGVDQ
jgi:type I restriction enzyme S subunit